MLSSSQRSDHLPMLLQEWGVRRGGSEGQDLWERWIGNKASISMECFHGHRLPLLGSVDEWSFLGSVFLGHFYWVSTENTGYWDGSSKFMLNCSPPPPNFLQVLFYLSLQMPTKHRFIECQSWKGPPPSLSSISLCFVKT